MPLKLARLALATLLVAGLAASRPASADEIPQTTPAGKAAAAWLAAFNAADPAQWKAFDAAWPRDQAPPIEDRLAFEDATGGFTVVRVEKSEPQSIALLLQEKLSDTVARLEMTVSSDDPPKLTHSTINAIPRPADLAIPRLKTQAEALSALSRRADELARQDRFSGVVLVARNGKVLLQKAWGKANRETGSPVTLDTQFRIGSMNKMFTSVSVLQLVQAGKLALDAPIGKYLTDYPNKDVASKVTVRHLLTHTGGTGDFFGPEFDKNRLTLREHGDYVKLYGARGLAFEPGTKYEYSNYGFLLLGVLIEKVTGTSYYDYVRDHVYKPAGMTATASLSEADKVPHRSTGYMREGGKWVPNTDTLPWRGTSAGGGYSTAGDLLKFAQALQSGKLIPKDLLAQATTPNKENYGFGLRMQGEGPLWSYGHGGGAPGMNGELRVFPRLGTVVVSFSNLDPPAANRLVDYFSLRMPAE